MRVTRQCHIFVSCLLWSCWHCFRHKHGIAITFVKYFLVNFFCNTEFSSSLSIGLPPIIWCSGIVWHKVWHHRIFPTYHNSWADLTQCPLAKNDDQGNCWMFFVGSSCGNFSYIVIPQKSDLSWPPPLGPSGVSAGLDRGKRLCIRVQRVYDLWFCHIFLKHQHSGGSGREFLVIVTLFL